MKHSSRKLLTPDNFHMGAPSSTGHHEAEHLLRAYYVPGTEVLPTYYLIYSTQEPKDKGMVPFLVTDGAIKVSD